MFDIYVCVYVWVYVSCHKALCCWVKEVNQPSLRNKEEHHVPRLFSPRPVP